MSSLYYVILKKKDLQLTRCIKPFEKYKCGMSVTVENINITLFIEIKNVHEVHVSRITLVHGLVFINFPFNIFNANL